jgi:hypothetical protein
MLLAIRSEFTEFTMLANTAIIGRRKVKDDDHLLPGQLMTKYLMDKYQSIMEKGTRRTIAVFIHGKLPSPFPIMTDAHDSSKSIE